MPVDRFTVSLGTELLAAFDRHIAGKGYENRSEAIRDLIRELLLSARRRDGNEPVVAFLTLLCDHRVVDAPKRVRTVALAHAELLQGTLSVPVDEHREGLSIALRGPSDRVHSAANQIQALRGVAYAHLSAVPVNE